ncbi:replication factor A protein 3 [Coniochaeta sp. 2T2.1]|nr:replication factor A protein 3 [Coniochaeta sp. 2T2.1]
MEATATPRVTSQYLDNYVGRNVMVVGKVVQLRGDTAVVDADGNVTAHLNRDSHLQMGSGAQLIGKVNSDLSIKVLSSTTVESPAGVDYDLYRTVVELSQLPSVKNLFVKDDSGGNVYN